MVSKCSGRQGTGQRSADLLTLYSDFGLLSSGAKSLTDKSPLSARVCTHTHIQTIICWHMMPHTLDFETCFSPIGRGQCPHTCQDLHSLTHHSLFSSLTRSYITPCLPHRHSRSVKDWKLPPRLFPAKRKKNTSRQ